MVSSSHCDSKFLPILDRQRVKLGLECFHWIFFYDVCINIVLVIVKINQIGCVVVLIALATLWAVSGEMSHFSALETWSMFIGTRVLFIHRGALDELYWGVLCP